MDAFYASVEQRDDPSLRGKPVVVGGSSNRGVVAAASYEAREYGVHSAMPMAVALRRCPHLLRVRPRMQVYRDVSKQVFEVFREFTPVVEGLSLDEAFLDISGSLKLFGSAPAIAAAVKNRIFERTRLTASVGVAENKLVAKIASDLEKPDGLVVVSADDYRRVLDPLPVSVIPGVGKKTLARMHAHDIRTMAGLRVAEDAVLRDIFGRYAARMRARASGLDDRPVVSSRAEKSVSTEETFDEDLATTAQMDKRLLRLADRTAGRLRKAGLSAATVAIKVRETDFTTHTRQTSLRKPVSGTDEIYAQARKLLQCWLQDHPGARVRLLGIGGSKLVHTQQDDLFTVRPDQPGDPVDRTVDQVRKRFGDMSLERARTLDKP